MRNGSAALEFETVYRRYDGLVRATLRHYGVRPADLDDVVQEAFVTIHRRLPEFEGRSSLETWLHAVSWRTAVGYRRRAHLRRESALTVEQHSEADPVLPELAPDRLHALLARLPEQQRELVALSEAGGLSITALAELSECTRETASERLKEALRALKRGIDGPPSDARDEGAPTAAQDAHVVPGAIETADSFDYIDDDVCICVLGANTFAIYRRGPDARRLRILQEAMRKAMNREGDKLTYMAVIEVGSATVPIDRDTRKVNQDIMRMLGRTVRGAAVTVESDGVFNLVPAVINTANFLSRSAIPFRFFTNVASAALWLAPRCVDETPQGLVAQIDWMRGRLDARGR